MLPLVQLDLIWIDRLPRSENTLTHDADCIRTMIESLLRPRRKRGRVDRSPFSSPFDTTSRRVTDDAPQRVARSTDEEEANNHNNEQEPLVDRHHESEYSVEDEDEDREPLLPIFSCAHLGQCLNVMKLCSANSSTDTEQMSCHCTV